MNRIETEDRLAPDIDMIPAPQSSPPTIDRLMVCVAERRRRRRVIRRGVAGMAAAACLLLVVSQLSDRNNAGDKSASLPNETSVAVVPQRQQDAVQVASAHVPLELETDAPKMRLFARFRGRVPVFQLDRDAQQISVVGWMEAQQSIPVDTRYLPRGQQDTFNAVLHGDAELISL